MKEVNFFMKVSQYFKTTLIQEPDREEVHHINIDI